MMEIMVSEAQKSTLKELSKKIQTECGKIFPLQNVLIRKVKLLKKPKFDLTKLMELYQERPEAVQKEKKEGEEEKVEGEPANLLNKK
jgi:small subunit ribosomal protein S3Ae